MQKMENKLAAAARREALKGWHGYVSGAESNLAPIIAPFPKWTLHEADGLWCAAFAYHCCIASGMRFPIRPAECASSNLAGCGAWEEWAQADPRIEYFRTGKPEPGDLVLFDQVFCNAEHDHIGVVLEVHPDRLITAEGNCGNVSAIAERPRDRHIRAFIRLPQDFVY
ncbi:MAG: CHAP domain-containing protein [Clostridia bacterium]|nr:CHAP domain-containing protein [Clostridia bacterium]